AKQCTSPSRMAASASPARSHRRRSNPPLFGPNLLPCRLLPAAFVAEREEALLVGGIDAPVAGAPHRAVLMPRVGRFHRRPRTAGGLQQKQRLPPDVALHRRLPRMAARISKREIVEIESRHAAMLNDIQRRTDNHGRDEV